MIEVGNIGVGELFTYNGALFVVLPFDWEENKYYNLCICSRYNDDDEWDVEYGEGEIYWFDENTKVVFVSSRNLKFLIPPIDN